MNMNDMPLVELPELTINSLANHIAKCFSEAVSNKQSITDRLLTCQRQRKGEYDQQMKTLIAATGGQEIFVMLTDIKCRAADAWIKDVMQNHNESTWSVQPTAEPELPPEITREIQGVVMQEAAAVAAQGIPVEPETMAARQSELLENVEGMIRDEAIKRAKRMESRITDKMQEGSARTNMSDLIYDFVTFPTVIIKGPVLRKQMRMKWSPEFTPVVTEEVVMDVDRVAAFDAFPGPSAVTPQDSYFIHRQRLTRKAVLGMKGMPGCRDDAISNVLSRFPNGYRTQQHGDNEYDRNNNREDPSNADGLLETLEYWGPASGEMLLQWGLTEHAGKPIDPEDEYQINAWMIAKEVIKAVINPDPLGKRPYSKASFVDVPGSFWGRALPELMGDVQILCNASARALAMNMGIASGPQCEVTVDRLPPGSAVTNQYPFKVWQTTSDRTGGGQPAIRYFQPAMNAAELLGIYTHFTKVADEVTGVPNYVYGSTAVGGAGRTSSGLHMLMENAAKGIKHAILSLDAAMSEVVKRIYMHLMIHDPDVSIKGDMQIVAAGAIGALIREQQEIARREFLASTLNPVDAQIIGPDGRAYMLRETAKTLFPDINKIVPDPDRMRALMAAQQQMQQPQPQQPQQEPAQQPQ